MVSILPLIFRLSSLGYCNFMPYEFFKTVLTGGLSVESEWQQIFAGFQNTSESPEYDSK